MSVRSSSHAGSYGCIARLPESGVRIASLRTQLLRAGTSIGANLEEANAAQSKADFIAKTRISLKEAREANYWLRLIEATEAIDVQRIHPLVQESHELVAVLTTIVRNASTPSPDS